MFFASWEWFHLSLNKASRVTTTLKREVIHLAAKVRPCEAILESSAMCACTRFVKHMCGTTTCIYLLVQ